MAIRFEGKVAHFPEKGSLVVCSDLQGNMRDFLRAVRVFRTEHELTRDAYLLFLGDLIHGHHNYTEATWPEWLGPFYEDESGRIVEGLLQLESEFPGRVCCLLGNHEHSQIGGIWLESYSDHFEVDAGVRLEVFKSFFDRLPLVALAPCGVVFSHASPSLQRRFSVADLVRVDYGGDYNEFSVSRMVETEPLGTLIWSRAATREQADQFLRSISSPGTAYNISICGHDPVAEGYDKPEINQLVLSTSYRMQEKNKVYLRLDLSSRYEDVDSLRVSHELLPLVSHQYDSDAWPNKQKQSTQ